MSPPVKRAALEGEQMGRVYAESRMTPCSAKESRLDVGELGLFHPTSLTPCRIGHGPKAKHLYIYKSLSPKSSAKMKIMSGFLAEAVLSSDPRITEKSLIFTLPALSVSWRGHSEPSIWSGSGQTAIVSLDLGQSSSSSSILPISRQPVNFLRSLIL